LALILSCPVLLPAQEQTLTLDDLAQSAQQWARENLDDDALKLLQGADQKRVKEFLAQLEKEFHGEYVIDLARLRDAAREIISILEQYEETLPYAIWLKSQLENLEVAEELRLIVPAPKPKPGQPARPPPNPQPAVVREIWIKKLAERPWPKPAKPYVAKLKPIFAAEGVPPELVWLAEVESSFDPRAKSPVGAAGMFQLMPATAKRYGLRTWAMDQRLEPEPSARAAAQYLKYLHGHFKDWRLAVAAYNAGEGTVDRLLARHKGSSYESIATHLPAETQLYVPRVEATILRREGVRLGQL
jgi:membrane-bound lytic murein transglycosylase D